MSPGRRSSPLGLTAKAASSVGRAGRGAGSDLGCGRAQRHPARQLDPIRSDGGEVVSVIVTLQGLEPLQELERLRADFLGMASHELRAPLTAIKGSAVTLLEDSAAFDPAERHEFYRIIAEQANHMRGLIGDLLDAGRIDAGTFSVAPEPSEVSALVDRARSTSCPPAASIPCSSTCCRTCPGLVHPDEAGPLLRLARHHRGIARLGERVPNVAHHLWSSSSTRMQRPLPLFPRRAPLAPLRTCCRAARLRHYKGEPGAAARPATLGPDAAPVRLDQPLADDQALPRRRPPRRACGAGAVAGPAPRPGPCRSPRWLRARRRAPPRPGMEENSGECLSAFDNRLLRTRAMRARSAITRGRSSGRSMLGATAGATQKGLARLVHQRGDLRRLRGHQQCARHDAPMVEQVAHQAVHPIGLLVDDPDTRRTAARSPSSGARSCRVITNDSTAPAAAWIGVASSPVPPSPVRSRPGPRGRLGPAAPRGRAGVGDRGRSHGVEMTTIASRTIGIRTASAGRLSVRICLQRRAWRSHRMIQLRSGCAVSGSGALRLLPGTRTRS